MIQTYNLLKKSALSKINITLSLANNGNMNVILSFIQNTNEDFSAYTDGTINGDFIHLKSALATPLVFQCKPEQISTTIDSEITKLLEPVSEASVSLAEQTDALSEKLKAGTKKQSKSKPTASTQNASESQSAPDNASPAQNSIFDLDESDPTSL